MFSKNFTNNWHFLWPFKKKQSFWERYETIWVVLISLTVITVLAYALRITVRVPNITEELYISPSAFETQGTDSFVWEKAAVPAKPEPSLATASLFNYFDSLNPFTALPARAEDVFSEFFSPTNPPDNKLTTPATNLDLISEPNIRVGLVPNLNPVRISNSNNYEIKNFFGDPLLTLGPDDEVYLYYDYYQNKYKITHGEIEIESNSFLILSSEEPNSLFTLHNYYNPPAWNLTYADNVYRGKIEFLHTPATNRIWVINELPLEDYLKGLAETTAYAPLEYLKVMTIAGRSYALWHEQKQQKHAAEFYDVQANQNDQVYKGYLNEQRHPNLSLAVTQTRGLVATYDDRVAVIPYFAGSDGYTAAWKKVWGGDKHPWVAGAYVPEEIGYTRLGHGVGLSQRGALLKIKNGETLEEVFETFFPDIKIQNIYAP